MSLTTPTTQDISDNIIAQLQATLNQTIPLLPKSFMRVLAKVLAGVFVLLYKYGGFISLQMFVRTATLSPTMINGVMVSPLTEWGRLVGVGDPVAATRAELTIDITVNTTGGTLPAGSQLVGPDNGVTYVTIGAVALNSTTVPAQIRAASDQAGGGGAGTIGNLQVGATVSFANPLAGVARDTIVTAQTTTGADAEDVDAYRQRVIDRFQKRPQGGAYADYEAWGEEVAGIANCYPYTSDNPGQVDVYVEAVVISGGDPDGIPTTAQLEAVQASIEKDTSGRATRRPAGALSTALPITRVEFIAIVTDLVVDNEAQVRIDIATAVGEYFLSREPFIDGLTPLPRRDRITGSSVTAAVEDVVSAAGGIFTEVYVTLGGSATDLYSLGIGEKAKGDEVIFA